LENPLDAKYLQGFYLGDLLIEPLKGSATGKNHSEHLPPTAAEVLVYLAQRPGEVVSHEDILAEVWKNGHGSRDAVTHAIGEIRHALDDHYDDPTFIQTLPTHGYRLLVEPVLASDSTISIPRKVAGPRLWQALLRHGVVQVAIAYLISGWVVIQIADVVFIDAGLPAWSKKFVLFAVIGGFPLVLALSWFLEFFEGRPHADRGEQSGGLLEGLGRNYLAIFVAYGLAVIGAGIYQAAVGFAVDEPPPAVFEVTESEILPIEDNTVAVLRLATFDSDPAARAFSDGLSEDILDALASIPGLSVPGRGDSWSLPEHATSQDVRDRLRAAYYIEGSVRFLSDRLRVVVQLIDSETGRHLFSRGFDIDIASIGEMQREVTELVIANLKLAVDESTIDAVTYAYEGLDKDAYLLYRLGREAMYRPRSEENFEEAIARFYEALSFDADYPAAHAGLCEAYAALFQLREDTALLDNASAACARAESVAPRLPVVLHSVARLYNLTGQLVEAERLYAAALDLNDQDVVALRGLAEIRRREQRDDEAEAMMQRANSLQPGNSQAILEMAAMYYYMGRYADAAAEYRKVLFLDPNNFEALANLAAVSMLLGDFEGPREALLRAQEIQEDPTLFANLALTYYYTDDYEAAIEIYRRAIELAPKVLVNRIGLADSLRAAGQDQEALDEYAVSRELALEQLQVRTNDVEALELLAWAQAQGGDIYSAQATAHRAVELDPGDPYTHYYEALVKLHAGKTDEAIDAAGRALDGGYPVAVLAAEPILRDLWNEPRFVELMARHSTGGQQ
jgi:TolB-like protein/DNA-binding winged helix-turn-helix (wHTH) protein/Tfp pilus assembly protein PilF